MSLLLGQVCLSSQRGAPQIGAIKPNEAICRHEWLHLMTRVKTTADFHLCSILEVKTSVEPSCCVRVAVFSNAINE